MLPLLLHKKELVSMATLRKSSGSHLLIRGNHYHFRLRVPTDLHSWIPSKEFLKSLKTTDRKTARLSASRLHSNLLEVFALLRSGFITGEQARERLDALLGKGALKRQTLGDGGVNHTLIPSADSSAVPLKPPVKLSQVIEDYTKDKGTGWTPKTKLEYSGYFRLIVDVLHDAEVSTITRDTIRKLRDTLSRLPSNLYKRHPNTPLEEVLKMDIKQPMSITTVNKLLTLLGGVMRHAIKEGFFTGTLIKDNPVEGLKLQKSKRAYEERKAYDEQDLRRIIKSLPSPSKRPERYWIPLIGMFSGMRLGEACGLYTKDIRQVDGVWCFDINEDQQDKRLKTTNSKRLVPVHPTLIQLGFIDFVKSCGDREKLWPNLKRRESDGYCSSLGKWFQRFNREFITKDPLKTFHSLRHTFADSLKQLGVQEVLIAELMGHANQSITTGRYGKRYQPKVLLEAISKLKV